MLKKILAAKTAAVVGAVTIGVVAAGASTGVLTSAEEIVETTDTTVAEETTTTTTAPEETTTTTTVAEETTTTTVPEETTTTTVLEETTTTTTTVPEKPEEPEAPGNDGARRGPDPHGPAAYGLCNAFGSRQSGPGGSVAAANLRDAAAAAGQTLEEFCAEVRPGGRSGDDGAPGAERKQAKADEPGAPGKGQADGKANGKGKGKGPK